MRNMATNLDLITCPVHYINGNGNGLTAIDSVRRFCATKSNFTLSEIPNVGDLAMYVEPAKVLTLLLEQLHTKSDIDRDHQLPSE